MKRYISFIYLTMLLFGLTACKFTAKKGVYTAIGARGDVIWLKPVPPETQYDSIVVTPLINELRDQLPNDVEEQIKESIYKALTKESETPGLVITFQDTATNNEVQMNTRAIFYDDVLDSRTLVVRIDLINKDKKLFASANVISRMSGFRNDSEVAKGIGQGTEDAMEKIFMQLTEHAEQNLENMD